MAAVLGKAVPCRTAGVQKKQRRQAISCFGRGAPYSGACHVPDHVIPWENKSVLKYQKTNQGQRLRTYFTRHTAPANCPSAKRPTGKRGAPAEPWAGTAPNAGAAGSTTEGQAGNRQQRSAVSGNVSLSFLHQTSEGGGASLRSLYTSA